MSRKILLRPQYGSRKRQEPKPTSNNTTHNIRYCASELTIPKGYKSFCIFQYNNNGTQDTYCENLDRPYGYGYYVKKEDDDKPLNNFEMDLKYPIESIEIPDYSCDYCYQYQDGKLVDMNIDEIKEHISDMYQHRVLGSFRYRYNTMLDFIARYNDEQFEDNVISKAYYEDLEDEYIEMVNDDEIDMTSFICL